MAKRESQRRYYIKNKESVLNRIKKWASENRERANENLRKWRKKNISRYKSTTAAWREENHEKAKKHSRDSYNRNKEKRREDHRKWIRNNPEASLSYAAKRRQICSSRKSASREEIIAIYRNTAAIKNESGVPHATDHIIPLSRGGFHHQDNLQTITKKMNEQKSANPFWLSPHVGIKDWRDVPRHLWPLDLVAEYDALIAKHKGETIRWDLVAA